MEDRGDHGSRSVVHLAAEGSDQSAGLPEVRPAERLTLTVPEAALLLGISRNEAYMAIQRGEIPARRVGRRIIISRVALERWLNGA